MGEGTSARRRGSLFLSWLPQHLAQAVALEMLPQGLWGSSVRGEVREWSKRRIF